MSKDCKPKTQGRPAPPALTKLRPGYTLVRLGDETGISVASLSRIFGGHRSPNIKVAQKIAEALDLTVDKLVAALPAR